MASSWNPLLVIRVIALAMTLTPALVWAQAPDPTVDPDKLSNDQPTRPLQMPAASSEAKEAFEDFERFLRRGAWERATKALYAIPEAQAGRFVDGPDGFIIPVARKRRAVLGSLTAEGLAAYRLFYDTEAKKLLDDAEGPKERANLEKLYSAYFWTSIGDNAADRLGDLYFEQGEFDRAAECWLAVFRERTDTDLSPALMATKAGLALAKAGRRDEGLAVRDELAARFADEVVTIAGKKAKATEHLERVLVPPAQVGGVKVPSNVLEGTPPVLSDAVTPAWQFRFAASVMAGMTPLEASQWENNGVSLAVPPSIVEGSTLYVNYLSYVFAIDTANGKLLWRSGSFHNLDVVASNDQIRMMIDPGRYAILAARGYVWSLGKDLKSMEMQGSSSLVCRRSSNGEVVWQTTEMADYSGLDLVGQPILAKDTLLIAGKSSMNMNMNGGQQDNLSRQYLLAIRPNDGKLLWKTEIGTFREMQQYYYYGMRDTNPQPRLAYRSGAVYIDTHVGVLAKVDAESGVLEWGYAYPTEPVQGQSRFFFFGMQQNQAATPVGPPPLTVGDAILIKGAKADRLCAIDPDRMKLLWDRPIAKSSRLVGVDDKNVYFGGSDLSAVDRKTRVLKWSTPLPGGSEDGHVLVRPDGLWQFTPRGIFEVDPDSGKVRRIFRGDDHGASGGDLILTDRWLLAISNRAITAYPRGGAGAGQSAVEGPAKSQTRGSDD